MTPKLKEWFLCFSAECAAILMAGFIVAVLNHLVSLFFR